MLAVTMAAVLAATSGPGAGTLVFAQDESEAAAILTGGAGR